MPLKAKHYIENETRFLFHRKKTRQHVNKPLSYKSQGVTNNYNNNIINYELGIRVGNPEPKPVRMRVIL